MVEVVVRLPEALRGELKEPLGPVHTDTAALLAEAGDPLVAVGDVVTYHLLQAGRHPDLALVDGKTEREAVDREIEAAIGGFDELIEVRNPAATLTLELLNALRAGLDGEGTTLLHVTGEEDLAALPAVVAAPDGASVVYGQPGEGMVLVTVTPNLRTEVRDLLARMDGDHDALRAALGLEAVD